jgi:hypothetical protein
MMNGIILRDFFRKVVTVYLDDICLYNRSMDEILEHLRHVLQCFKIKGLKLLRLKKCSFCIQEKEYLLGYTMSNGRIPVSTENVFANAYDAKGRSHFLAILQLIYAKFIHQFSNVTAPLTDLLRKSHSQKITQMLARLEAFEILKLQLISAPCVILLEVRSDATLTVATYASFVDTTTLMLQDQG